jgi:membrane protein implicated in regulation of membrane protease activity
MLDFIWLTNLMGIVWLVILVVLVVIEIVTLGLTTIWFAGGALAAFIATLLRAEIWLQIVIFLVVSVVLLLGTRPIALKYFNSGRQKTNLDLLMGSMGIVIEEIDNNLSTGMVNIQGQEWTARSLNDTVIEKNKKVMIVEIRGVKLIVKEN